MSRPVVVLVGTVGAVVFEDIAAFGIDEGVSLVTAFFVKDDLVTAGLVMEGLVMEGLATEGLVTEGLVTEGLVTEGLVTESLVTEGLVPEGLVADLGEGDGFVVDSVKGMLVLGIVTDGGGGSLIGGNDMVTVGDEDCVFVGETFGNHGARRSGDGTLTGAGP